MTNPFRKDPNPRLTAAIRAVCESHSHEKLVGLGVGKLRKLEREYAAKAAAGNANAERELADIRAILKGKGVQEQKTLTKGEVSAVKRANAADLKEYPGKRGETAHRRLHKVLKKVTEEKRRVTSIADLAPKHSPQSQEIIRANLGRGIRASAHAAAEGKPMKRSERARRERVQAILGRRSGVGSLAAAPRQKAAREAERAARALGESALDEGSLSRLSDAELKAKEAKHNIKAYQADMAHYGSKWKTVKTRRGKEKYVYDYRAPGDPKLKTRALRHGKASDLAKAERERRGAPQREREAADREFRKHTQARLAAEREAERQEREERESNPVYQRNLAKFKARLAARKAAAEKKN